MINQLDRHPVLFFGPVKHRPCAVRWGVVLAAVLVGRGRPVRPPPGEAGLLGGDLDEHGLVGTVIDNDLPGGPVNENMRGQFLEVAEANDVGRGGCDLDHGLPPGLWWFGAAALCLPPTARKSKLFLRLCY